MNMGEISSRRPALRSLTVKAEREIESDDFAEKVLKHSRISVLSCCLLHDGPLLESLTY
jgi:hypothetical protein